MKKKYIILLISFFLIGGLLIGGYFFWENLQRKLDWNKEEQQLKELTESNYSDNLRTTREFYEQFGKIHHQIDSLSREELLAINNEKKAHLNWVRNQQKPYQVALFSSELLEKFADKKYDDSLNLEVSSPLDVLVNWSDFPVLDSTMFNVMNSWRYHPKIIHNTVEDITLIRKRPYLYILHRFTSTDSVSLGRLNLESTYTNERFYDGSYDAAVFDGAIITYDLQRMQIVSAFPINFESSSTLEFKKSKSNVSYETDQAFKKAFINDLKSKFGAEMPAWIQSDLGIESFECEIRDPSKH